MCVDCYFLFFDFDKEDFKIIKTKKQRNKETKKQIKNKRIKEMETNLMDLSPLIRLKEALEVSNNNTASMIFKLKDFDTRLLSLDKKMLPIQNVK